MESNHQTITAGKYEAMVYMLDDNDRVKAYLESCIDETMRAGFDRKTAALIEQENISQFIATRYDKLTQRRLKAVFQQLMTK